MLNYKFYFKFYLFKHLPIVDQQTKQELYRPSSPTCVSSQFIRDKTKRSPKENRERTSSVTSKFPVQRTKESITNGVERLVDVS